MINSKLQNKPDYSSKVLSLLVKNTTNDRNTNKVLTPLNSDL